MKNIRNRVVLLLNNINRHRRVILLAASFILPAIKVMSATCTGYIANQTGQCPGIVVGTWPCPIAAPCPYPNSYRVICNSSTQSAYQVYPPTGQQAISSSNSPPCPTTGQIQYCELGSGGTHCIIVNGGNVSCNTYNPGNTTCCPR